MKRFFRSMPPAVCSATYSVIRSVAIFKTVGVAFVGVLGFAGVGLAELGVAWDPSPDERVTGYVLYWQRGETVGAVDAKAETQVVLGDLAPGTYIFWATAYDQFGNESPKSETLTHEVPGAPLNSNELPPQKVVLPAPATLSITEL